MGKKQCSVLFLGKFEDEHAEKAAEFCRANFTRVRVFMGQWDDPMPPDIKSSKTDLVISYLSRWIVPARVLKAAYTAINFHPGPPEYPGYGCNNFALYEEAKDYGVTCHRMAPRVDTGEIIAVKRFPILPTDNAATLLARAYDFQIVLFYDMIGRIIQGEDLPTAQEKWTRKPFTRKQFAELGRITPGMSRQEIARRIRATAVGMWRPIVELQGFTFELKRMPE